MGLTSEMAEQDGRFEVQLPPQPASVAAARRRVRTLLEHAGRLDLIEPTVLLVSEIVTNALLHAGTEITLAATLSEAGVRVEVGDGNTHLPSRRRYAATAGTGRGLMMLESMVDDWGVHRHPDGKVVWFDVSSVGPELPDPVRLHASASPATDDRDTDPGRSEDCVPVELANMPLLLHAAWQEHAEALLREYLLASLDGDDDSLEPIQMHAEATDAIAVLEEHLPRSAKSLIGDEVMAGAVEPSVTVDLVQIPVPVASVPHFATLDRAIEAALALSRDGLVLTPSTQPEVQEFRRWVCRQVLRQSSGAHPEPWVVPDVIGWVGPALLEWDPDQLAEAGHGVIAADQSSAIIGVSPEAAALLGYDDPRELVGQRIVSIVPERLRQAHVAGFTMYLLVGRRPLIDRTVVVPALRKDGTEVEVELHLHEQSVGEGQTVVLADIAPVTP